MFIDLQVKEPQYTAMISCQDECANIPYITESSTKSYTPALISTQSEYILYKHIDYWPKERR